MQTAQKIVKDQLGMSDCEIAFDFTSKEYFEDEEESLSYPGLRTVYRKEIFEGRITSSDQTLLKRICAIGTGEMKVEDPKKSVRLFSWMTEQQCESAKIRIRTP